MGIPSNFWQTRLSWVLRYNVLEIRDGDVRKLLVNPSPDVWTALAPAGRISAHRSVSRLRARLGTSKARPGIHLGQSYGPVLALDFG